MKQLESWFKKIARPLPWRETQDPYRIWVSEVMLQQTQVDTVIDYYHRFLKRFPTLQSLAKSTEQDVLTLWSGLGYYRRAKNLRLGAQYLTSLKTPFPKEREHLLQVPGIGPYTAGALLSIAFDLPEPLVDGNVQRVFARFFGVRDIVQSSKAQKFFWKKAQELVSQAHSPRMHNQALMELGSLVCKKGTPLCHRCPISNNCVAFAKNWQQKLPVSATRTPMKDIHWIVAILQKKSKNGEKKYLIKQNIETNWWSGLWDFPSWPKDSNKSWATAEEVLKKQLGKNIKQHPLNYVRHTVTHHRIQVAPFLIDWPNKTTTIDGKWVSSREIENIPLSALAKKIFRQLALC